MIATKASLRCLLPALLASALLVFAGSEPGAPVANKNAATAGPATPASAEIANVRKLLEQKFPGASVGSIAKSPYSGLYEIQFDDRLVYTDPKVSYVFVGTLYDANSKRNLTEERVRKLTRVSWDNLPLELAIKKVKGTGARKLAVFADADCPFCARLESELKNVDNVTIYTFLFPLDQLHPDAARKSKLIWCAPDRVAAWDEWFASKKLPDNAGDCETPLEQTIALGMKLRVSATPTLVFADGSMLPGAAPAQRVEQELSQAERATSNAAAEAAKPAPRAAKAQAK
jgi:thiol:disulfide interchange protein DsbC